jgi:hypothetical protein
MIRICNRFPKEPESPPLLGDLMVAASAILRPAACRYAADSNESTREASRSRGIWESGLKAGLGTGERSAQRRTAVS